MLAQTLLAVDAVEEALEGLELREGGLPHEREHALGGVLWGYLQAAADMAGNQFAGVLLSRTVHRLVFAAVEQQVVAHAAADEALLHTGTGIYCPVELQ